MVKLYHRIHAEAKGKDQFSGMYIGLKACPGADGWGRRDGSGWDCAEEWERGDQACGVNRMISTRRGGPATSCPCDRAGVRVPKPTAATLRRLLQNPFQSTEC